MRSLRLLCVVFVLSLSAFAQQWQPELTVKVIYADNDQPVRESVKIQIVNEGNLPVMESFSRNGEVRFMNVTATTFRVRAVGPDIEESITPWIYFNPRSAGNVEYLPVKFKSRQRAVPPQGSISASSLHVPPDAKKEYDKGLDALKKKKLDEAKKRFEAAITIYPSYAGALNNLGIVSQMAGDSAAGDAYFEKAIAADSGYANAYLNLAKSRMVDKRVADAEKLLLKHTTLEPGNLESAMLLTNIYVVTNKQDEAVAMVRKVHGGPHEGFEIVHFLLGASYQTHNELKKAADEYRLYLKEAPGGQNSQAVRAALVKIEEKLAAVK